MAPKYPRMMKLCLQGGENFFVDLPILYVKVLVQQYLLFQFKYCGIFESLMTVLFCSKTLLCLCIIIPGESIKIGCNIVISFNPVSILHLNLGTSKHTELLVI